MSKTLDQWVDENAHELRNDIETHLSEAMPEDQARLIMISIRQWAELRDQAMHTGKPVTLAVQSLEKNCCSGCCCLRCHP